MTFFFSVHIIKKQSKNLFKTAKSTTMLNGIWDVNFYGQHKFRFLVIHVSEGWMYIIITATQHAELSIKWLWSCQNFG
jgi:hypothetical protein